MIWVFLILWMAQANAECQSGQYNDSATYQCVDCPAGFSTSESIESSGPGCHICDEGTYASRTGAHNCTLCPGGWVQPDTAATECVECHNYTLFEKQLCVDSCPDASWENETSKMCDVCAAGRYYTADNECTACADHFFKAVPGIPLCVECPRGYFGNVTKVSCDKCDPGYTTVENECTPCAAGRYEIEGNCMNCMRGTYTADTGQSTCSDCPEGYGTAVGTTSCAECAAGRYSAGVDTCNLCPRGFGTEVAGSINCTQCRGAQTTDGSCVKCAAGLYLDQNDARCIRCPAGYEDTNNRDECAICNAQTFSNDGLECKNCGTPNVMNGKGSWKCCASGQEGCSICAAGQYRSGEACATCPQGYVAQVGADACTKCDAGAGVYQNEDGQHSCKTCLEGQEATFDQTCKNCPAGWSELGFECRECPRGWYSTEPANNVTGNKVCTSCPVGSTTPSTGRKDSADVCSVTCKDYEVVDTFGECQFCGAGQYVSSTTNECNVCPLGWFKATPLEKECAVCPTGYNTDTTGQLACFVCEPGTCRCSWGEFFNTNGRCEACPSGFFSTGDDECTACAEATYQDEQGQGSCKSCPVGTFEDGTRSTGCKNCARGHFQPFIASQKCHDCPKGRYSDVGQEECTMCPEGSSTEDLESTDINDCVACPAGTMESERVCTSCSEGLYQNDTGKVTCKSCPEGTWSSPGSSNVSDCFRLGDMVTYTFGNMEDSKPATPFTTTCELRANFVMLCPACTCDADSRNGFWAGPLCNECARGFATRYCTSICPGYDGIHDSTICNGNGRCWFGRQGTGLCYCGGKDVLDPSAEDVFVDVRYCPAGQICPGYGVEKMSETAYIPLYYLLNYRQYTAFVLQMTQYTPERGHMWFKRYSPSKGFENTCTQCVDKYSDTVVTSVGYWSYENEYHLFPTGAQSNTGFHGENCQYECAACLNGGECVHSPHPYAYSYTIEDTFRVQKSVNLPVTTCLCSSNVFDPSHMCCPNGFQPYVYDGKRGTVPYSRYTTVPHVTAVDNDIGRGYYADRDVFLEPDLFMPYAEPGNGKFVTTRGREINTNSSFAELGPYNKHVYHGTTKEICRACPGLFGKGVRAVGELIETESQAENYWWNFPASAGSKKCNGQGVCDFYLQKREFDVDFMGSVDDWALLHRATLCTNSIPPGRVKFYGEPETEITTLEQCVAYGLSKDASYVGWAPEYYMGGTDADMVQGASTAFDYGSSVMARDEAESSGATGWAVKSGEFGNIYTVIRNDLPIPDGDSVYRVYNTLEKRCVAYKTCNTLKAFNSPAFRAFNVYTIERGRGDARLESATFDRFDTCFTYTKNYDFVADVAGVKSAVEIDAAKTSQRQKFGLYLTELYKQGQDPFLGGQCPKGYFCSQNSQGTGFKEACPVGHYQPLEGQTRLDKDTHCSRVDYNASSCQPNLATKNISDHVDKACLRCPRNSYAPEGSEICSECPPGRVKKVSGSFDPANVDVFNIPTNTTPFWFYIPNEGGTRDDDCAVVPSSVLHIPTANDKMYETDADEQFLPVISCPYGYSSQPGSYIIEDIWSLQNILEVDNNVMGPPYIYIDGAFSIEAHDVPCACVQATEGNAYYVPVSAEQCELAARRLEEEANWAIDGVVDGLWHGCLKMQNSRYVQYNNNPQFVYNYPTNGSKYICERIEKAETLIEEVVGAYCYPCPGDAMTGPGSGICSTCTANLIKKNMKTSLQKLIVNSERRMYYCGSDGNAVRRGELDSAYTLTANAELPAGHCAPITYASTDTTYDVEYSKDILAWYYQKKDDRIWPAQHIFGAIQDPSMPGASIEFTVADCILACTTVFNTSYNFSDAVKPVRVGYARDEFERNYCMCNEGDGTADATGVATDKTNTATGSNCYAVVRDESIRNEECVTLSELNVTWYESTIVDDWGKTEFPLCGLCSPGKFYSGSACVDCPTGQYTADMVQSMKTQCQFCPAGYYQDTTGNSGCLECRPGTYGPAGEGAGLTKCVPCDAGKHQDEYKMGSCKSCPQGYTQGSEGRPECDACRPGQFQDETNSDDGCKACGPGQFAGERGAAACQQCPEGQSQSVGGQTLCQSCSSGQFASGTSQSSCIACPPGEYQDAQGASDCKACRPGTAVDICTAGDSCSWPNTAPTAGTSQYNDINGQSKCKVCPAGHTCAADTAPVRCLGGYAMPPGLYSEKCYKCPIGQYSNEDKSACLPCGAGSKTDAARSTCTACPANHGTMPQECGVGTSADCDTCRECGEGEALIDGKCVSCCYGTVTLFQAYDTSRDTVTGKLTVAKGDYNSNRLHGLGNDQMSSLIVPQGCTAEVFEHAGFQGASHVFSAGDHDMRSSNFGNDVLSSFKIRESPGTDGACSSLGYNCQPVNARIPTMNFGASGCSPGQKCGLCQGDCDNDADCQGNLRCYGLGKGGKEPHSIGAFPDYCTGGKGPAKHGYCLVPVGKQACQADYGLFG